MTQDRPEEQSPGFSADVRRRQNILWISPVPRSSKRARLPRVFVAHDLLPNPAPAFGLVGRTGPQQIGGPQIRQPKATCPRRQSASEADATAPSNRRAG